MRKILLCDDFDANVEHFFAGFPDIELTKVPAIQPVELRIKMTEFDAVLTRSSTSIPAEAYPSRESCRLKVIGRGAIGIDNIDLAVARERGIPVFNEPFGNVVSTAEFTMGVLLAMVRFVPQAHQSILRGEWKRRDFTGIELYGKTLGILGLGRIGSELASRARAFGMDVLAFDTNPRAFDGSSAHAAPSLDALLREADIVSIHVPMTAETRNLLGKQALQTMRKGSYLINMARGGIVCEADLAEALHTGHLAGAAMDVFSEEPVLPNNPLLTAPRCILTPHLGSATKESQSRIGVNIAKRVLRYLDDGDPRGAVNMPVSHL